MPAGPRSERKIRNPGKGSLYRPEYDEQAFGYALMGASVQKLADLFGVSKTGVENWMRDYPSFREAIHRGRDGADQKVASALYRRALGYDLEFTKEESGSGPQGAFEKTTRTTNHIPADVTAGIFWLRSRQDWRDKNDEASGGNISIRVIGGLPDVNPPAPEPEKTDPSPRGDESE